MKKNGKTSFDMQNDIGRNSFEIDYDKLAEAIVSAEIKAKNEIEEREKNEKADVLLSRVAKYDHIFGIKLPLILAYFWMMICIKRKDIESDETTLGLLHFSTEYILNIAEYIIYLFIAVAIYKMPQVNIPKGLDGFITVLIIVVILLIMFFFARSLRISRFEIENIKDRDYLNTISGSLMTVFATIIAIIEFLRSIR